MRILQQVQRSLSPQGRELHPVFIWFVMVPTGIVYSPIWAISVAIAHVAKRRPTLAPARFSQEFNSLEHEFTQELQWRRLRGNTPLSSSDDL
ncbi:MAG: hypothetical protein ACFE0I_23490 [Elainellaceae cyanobacterium]